MARSPIPRADELGELRETPSPAAERGERRDRGVDELVHEVARAVDPREAHEGRLVAVEAGVLTGDLRSADRVEQIVRDLEREPQVLRVRADRLEAGLARASHQGPDLRRSDEEAPRLVTVDELEGLERELLPGRGKVHELPA